MSKKTVALICASIFIGILAFDAYLYLDGVPGNSISQVIIDLSGKSMLVPWLAGFLMGALTMHFFDNYKEPR